jgi:tetratricopeptide (TPR) repeat protein
MPNLQQIFILKLAIFFLAMAQSFNCQANVQSLQKADSLFNSKNYQEALEIYKEILQDNEAYSPAMLLKMAFISEGMGDFPQTTLYLSKYYDHNPTPQIPDKIKELTNQTSLTGYAISDRDRLIKILTDHRQEITSTLAVLLVLSLVMLVLKGFRKGFFITSLFLLVLVFLSNNFLDKPTTGIITGNPSLIMTHPSAGGSLIKKVGPGHRVIINSPIDIWYEIEWEDQEAFVKKDHISGI